MKTVSVVICTYNNSSMLAETLRSLGEATFSRELVDLVVVDNNSSDETRKVVEHFVEQELIETTYVLERAQGLAKARNKGVSISQGEILLFTDDDVKFEEGFLTAVVRTFETTDAAIVGGRILLSFPAQRPSWLSDSVDYIYGKVDLGSDDVEFPPSASPLGPCLAIRREMFSNYGLFNEDMGLIGLSETVNRGEEVEFVSRARMAGERIFYSGESVVHHMVRPERLTREWFVERFQHAGLGVGESAVFPTMPWWRNLLKYVAAVFVRAVGQAIRNQKIEFYGRCKSAYFGQATFK